MSETSKVVPIKDSRAEQWRETLITASIALGIALAAFIIYILPALVGRPLSDAPEARVAAVAREMLKSGDYMLPKLGGEASVHKPPLPFWLAALSSAIFFGGWSASNSAMTLAALLPPAVSAALAVFLVIFFGSRFFGRASGIMAGLILGAAYLTAHYAHMALGDSTLMLACAATVCGMAILLNEKPGSGAVMLTAVGLAAAILTKGHIPLILIAVPVAVEFILRRDKIGWSNVFPIALAFAIGIAVAVVWVMLVSRKDPNAFGAMVSEAANAIYQAPVGNIAAVESPSAPTPRLDRGLGYYSMKSVLGLLPWTPFLVIGAIVALLPMKGRDRTPPDERGTARFFALYAGIGFVIFHIAQQRQDFYLLPLLPALALTAGALFGRFQSPGGICEERMAWWQLALGAVGSVFIACPFIWAPAANALQALGIGKSGVLTNSAVQLAATLGWIVFPLAAVFFAMSFLCARFWASGQSVIVIALFAAASFGINVYSAVRAGERARNTAFIERIDALNRDIASVGDSAGNALYYSSAPDDAVIVFYTGKNIRSLKTFGDDEALRKGVPVYLIVQGRTPSVYGVPLGAAAVGLNDGFSLINLALEPELQVKLSEEIKKRHAGEK